MIVEKFPDRMLTLKGKDYLYFGGTGYLGLATHPEFQDFLISAFKNWGTFYGSSRNSNIKLSIYKKFESYFAAQIGAEATLTVSSGTLAGRLIIDFLAKRNPVFFHYPKTHPAILAKNSLPLFINGQLNPRLTTDTNEEIVITTDAILGLEVEPVSFSFLDLINKNKEITLVVDESHSLGVVGKNGNGIFNNIKHKKLSNKIMVSSLGKALSLSGGIIGGSQNFIKNLVDESMFVSSSAANPAYLEAYCKASKIFETQRRKLAYNLNYISDRLNNNSTIKFDKRYPVLYSEDEYIYNKLFEEGIIITSFKYPTYKNRMNRIVITANHTEDDLDKLIKILNIKE
ncbi:aminotransferase class I/II-fold pyridoxal phosphate-dependent enzyme [Aureibaculum marinum]|uniref:Aminotransferase class I/II-fold pyridoxal phosphate-dependent enzyme n=1 Tax=Aureibaculum marinum TaxID=2487930 RepID=A0A3N4NMG1_9FLAO|nr:aminotransferase class I/II-fold pyridoxal phosphate-dependent enzyme [Aureibaculum marinum]RPD96735.1 aminotransferase class I/II-fold pyridoxal phosphate-dependent enzyme [Aureibaculum marinum]